MDDIKKGEFIGVGAMPQADGSQKAIRVNIFDEARRGTGEGHRPGWGPDQKGTMTNATVDTTVGSVDGQVIMLKYKDGEKKVIVPPEATVTAADGTLHPVQRAFHEQHALQCGFCTPGMIMTAVDLLRENPHPSEAEIREGMSGNLCRCTGYQNIVRAVQAAANGGASASAATEAVPASPAEVGA